MIQNLTFDLLHIRGKWQIIEQLECMVTLVTYHLAKIGHMVYENSSTICFGFNISDTRKELKIQHATESNF